MALSDWQQNFLAFPGNMIIVYEVLTPLVGTGSAKFSYTNTSVGHIDLSAKVGAIPGETYALSHGRIRTLVKPHFNAGNFFQGIYFMASQSYIASSTGAYYAVNVNGAALNFQVRKQTSGGMSGFNTSSTLGSGGAWVAGNTYGLEVEWHQDIPNLNGVFITVKVGSALNFSDLTTIITLLDTSTPLSTTLGEGLFVSNLASASGSTLFDDTRLTRLIPT